ncbi:CAP domain-containing protein [Aeribacillus pallidus]|uniref:Membrane protein YlbC n=1 Tax=Aeribacillus pallidus TaxID=33936 RepID=A0A223E8V7_9BACI|nr:CAP domain-containing protein [Aeribacillus pallidus]ASS91679.1 hypothetical protein AP3564_16835 [Aeribacillus pallidus]
MKRVTRIILIFVIITLTYIVYVTFQKEPVLPPEQQNFQEKTDKEIKVGEGVISFVGRSSKEVLKTFGKPDRIDPSRYDYEWWIYRDDLQQYKQFGVLNGKVVTVFAIGKEVNVDPFQIGQPSTKVFHIVAPNSFVTADIGLNSYRFELSEDDLNVRPTVRLNDDLYVQLYMDKFTGTLSSIRAFDVQTLVKQRPYEVVYRGELLEAEPITEEEQRKIEYGEEQQIVDITNVIRTINGLSPLKQEESTAKVAYSHSKEMSEKGYFSHVSPERGSLSDRLTSAGVHFEMAGENIAHGYMDGIDVVEGWLNSEGHRKTLLDERFTHIGVGVYEKFYTQNFIAKRAK